MVSAIHIEIDALFFLLLLTIALQSARSVSQQMSRVLFRYTVYGIMAALALDILWMLVDGRTFPGAIPLNAVVNALFLSCGVIIGCVWYLYVLETLGHSITRPLAWAVLSPGILFTVLNLISLRTGWIFIIDGQNHYVRGPLFWLQTIGALTVLFASLLHIVFRLLSGDQRVPRSALTKLLRFYIIPVIGTLVTIPFAGMPGTWTCAAVSVVLMYIDGQDGEILRDSLTGLNNRKTLDSAFAEYSRQATEEVPLYFFMIDLDDFKGINDTLGHAAGDRALAEAAKLLLRSVSGRRVTLARVGGDEFVVLGLLPGEEAAGEFLRQIQEDFLRFGRENDRPYRLAASVGYSRYTPGQTLAELSAEADKALYRDKTFRKAKARTA